MKKESSVSYSAIMKDGIIYQNPVFVTVLGMCPVLAITTSVMNAVGMAVALLFILILTNVVISAMRKIVPSEIRIPAYIIMAAAIVSCADQLMNAFTPELYSMLGLFIPLIVVNCIILGRAEAFANKNTVVASFFDAVGNAVGYGMALLVMAFIRELVAKQSYTFYNPFNSTQSWTLNLLNGKGFLNMDILNIDASLSFFATPAGGFITLSIVLATLAAIKSHKSSKKAKKSALVKEASK